MKTAKKLIFMILVVAFAFIFAACNDEQEHTHNFVEGSCECGEKDPNYVPPHTHSYSSVVTAPTCTEAGYTTFTCECGDTYKEDGEAALGHTEVVDAAVAATCTTAGKTEGKHCSVCNEVLVAQEEVAALGHTEVVDAAVAATCTTAGKTEGKHCSVCNEVLVAQEEVAALGHKFIDSKCENCEEQFVAPVGGWTLVTELKDGDNVLIAAPAYNKLLSTVKVATYYNKGIDYTSEDYSNVTDAEIFVVTVNADGTYTFTSLTGVVIALSDDFASLNDTGVNKSWTLEEKGNGLFYLKNTKRGNYLEWYASKNNWSTYKTSSLSDLFELSFYAKGEATDGEHVHNHISSVHAATCTEAGYTAYTCRCGDTYKVDGEAALGHTEVVDAAVAATCTEAGKTEGKHCSVCNEVLVAQEEVAALGHSYKEGTCEVCGDKESSGDTEVTKGSADFNTIVTGNGNKGDGAYTNTYTTTNGWVTVNSAIQAGGATVMNPQYPVIGPDNSYKAVCLNGKTSAPGKLTSPTLNDGLSKLVVKFTKIFTDTELSVTVTVTELSTGNVYTHVIAKSLDKSEKYVVYTEEWVLETPVTGDFTIEIVNNCPTKQDKNKDRMTILSIDWEGAVPTHTHEYESTTTATCTAAGVTTYTCSCGDTYTEETEKLGHVDANLDIDCDREGCTTKVAPAAESILSNFTANNLGSKLSTSYNYYVEGTIVEVLDAKNGIFYLDDGTGEKFYFRLPKNEAGVSHANWAVRLVLGDKVRVYGKINKFTASTAPNGQYYPAIQGGTVTYIEQHPHVFGEPTCFDSGYCECGQAGPAALGHSDVDANGFCDVCEWNMSHEIEKIKTHFNDVKDTENLNTAEGTCFWAGEEFKVQVAKGTGTLNTNGTNHFRVQKNNILTISSINGKKMVSITLESTTEKYATALKEMFESEGYTVSVNGLEVTINVDSLDTVSITTTTLSRIASVKVVYEKSAE